MKRNVWEEKLHKSRMESTLGGSSYFNKYAGGSAFTSTIMQAGRLRGQSARRYKGGSTLMSKTGNKEVFGKKNSSFQASRAIDQSDQFSNETHPYQLREDGSNVYNMQNE